MGGRLHPGFCAIKFIMSSACRAAVWDSLYHGPPLRPPAAPGTILLCGLGLGITEEVFSMAHYSLHK
jgi:hypothetical protein